MKLRNETAPLRKISIALHRELGFLFAGIVCVYALSGILMNHRHELNPNYSVEITELQLPTSRPTTTSDYGDEAVAAVLAVGGVDPALVTKSYPSKSHYRILIKGGSSITVEPAKHTAVYEKLSQRPLLSQMVRLHYNPGKWWTAVSDIFAASLILLAVTGCIIPAGRKGLRGRGGIELIIGIALPVLFSLLFI